MTHFLSLSGYAHSSIVSVERAMVVTVECIHVCLHLYYKVD